MARTFASCRAGAWLVAAAVTAAAAGCGADDVSPEAVAAAADKTAGVGGMKMSIEGHASSSGQEFPFEGEGVMDVGARRAHLELRMRLDETPPGVEPRDLRFEMITDRLAFYMRSPLFEGNLPGDAQWLKVDLVEATRGTEIDFAQLEQMAANDPTQTLRYLRAVGDVDEVGREDVRGVETTHYEATVELRRYPQLVPADERAAAERTIEALIERTGTDTVDMEAWVDGDDLVRRLKQGFTQELEGGLGELEMEQTIEMYDFGTDADIEVPAGRDVADLSNVARRRLGSDAAKAR